MPLVVFIAVGKNGIHLSEDFTCSAGAKGILAVPYRISPTALYPFTLIRTGNVIEYMMQNNFNEYFRNNV